MIVELNDDNFEYEIKNGIKLVEFYATWCVYCKKQRIELMNFENSDSIWVGIVDGDESPNLLRRYKISSYPSFILFREGSVVTSFSGYHSKEQILSRVLSALKDN